MATFRAHKVVSTLPDPLQSDTIYLVRVGEGFDIYATDTTGLVAHKLNAGLSWMDYVAWPSNAAGVTAAGAVNAHARGGVTVYRLIPSPYVAAQDAIYTTFAGGVLSGLLTTRG
jgi:hypothetical protein